MLESIKKKERYLLTMSNGKTADVQKRNWDKQSIIIYYHFASLWTYTKQRI